MADYTTTFAQNYISDTRALAVIMQTINKKNAIIPGVTVKSDLAGLVQANVAEYYYNLAPNVVDATAGDNFDSSNAGSKKAVLNLTRALQIDEKIPNVAISSTQADVLYDRMVKGALAVTNALGKKFLHDLTVRAERANTEGTDLYEKVINAIGQFSSLEINGGFSNVENGVQPTTLLVGNKARAELMKSDGFQRLINASGEMPSLIGTMAGLNVVYSQDLDTVLEAQVVLEAGEVVSNSGSFMLLNAEGIAYPYSINTMRVVESELFNGIRVQAEIGYPKESQDDILPITTYALVLDEPTAV